MMALPIGMVLGCQLEPAQDVGHPGGEQDDGDQSRGDAADALDRQVRIGLPAIVPGAIPKPAAAVPGARRNRAPMKMMPTAVNPASAYPMSVTSMAFLLAPGKSAAPDPALRQPGQQPHLPQRPGPVQTDPPQLLSGAQQRSLVTGSRVRVLAADGSQSLCVSDVGPNGRRGFRTCRRNAHAPCAGRRARQSDAKRAVRQVTAPPDPSR
jgi:hypothetical protein